MTPQYQAISLASRSRLITHALSQHPPHTEHVHVPRANPRMQNSPLYIDRTLNMIKDKGVPLGCNAADRTVKIADAHYDHALISVASEATLPVPQQLKKVEAAWPEPPVMDKRELAITAMLLGAFGSTL